MLLKEKVKKTGHSVRWGMLCMTLIVPFLCHAQDQSCRGDSLRPSLAIKTNLLYDVLFTPNFEIEKDLGPRLSLMAETAFPWYTWHHNLRSYEVFETGGELRWWMSRSLITPQRRLTGTFLGCYGAGGYYDLEWAGTGHRGSFWSVGLSFGYSQRIARHWNLEYAFGYGYVGGPYRSYEADEAYHLVKPSHNGRINYIGPTKIKVSLVWMIGNRKERERR